MPYGNIYTKTSISNLNLISDSQNMLIYTTTAGGESPPIIEKSYNNYYEFILTSGEKKILIIDTILEESHINEITGDAAGNNKGLLHKAYISNNCSSIGQNCFKDCSNLSYISYTNIGTAALLTNVKSSAFEGCVLLDECKIWNISNNITTIEDNAFKKCNKLFEVQLENTPIQSIGANTFENCNYLVTIHFPSTLLSIGSNCFKNTGLTNIYFDNYIPATLGSTIFGSTISEFRENAVCYYNNNYIFGASYAALKNLFPNNGSDTVFIEINNNTIENGETFYTVDNNNNNVTQSIIDTATNIINSIIIKRNGTTMYTINVDYDGTLSGTTILGWATWSNGHIRLNPDNDTGNDVYFNSISTNLNSVVLVHEILHILGFGDGTEWNSFKSNYYFTGKNAIYQYNKLLYANGYKKKLNYLTIEDSGGAGTIGSHTEEGLPHVRYDADGNIYPSFENEIMSGWLDSSNYFTRQCCGVLQDLEYSINYNSSYVYNDSISYTPSITPEQTNLTSNITNTNNTNNPMNFKIKCNCCMDLSNNHIISTVKSL